MLKIQKISWGKDLLILSGLVLFLFTFFLSHRHFATPDEGRYVEIAREMVETGDYLTPRLNGLKYFEKPPLFYWMQAGMIQFFGIHEGVMRLWTTFLGLLGCLFVYAIGRFLVSRRAGFLAAGVLATSALYFVLARLIILDMAVAVFISGALLSFWMSTTQTGRRRFVFLTGYGLFMALATLTKGLIGAVLPGAVILLWIGVMRDPSLLRLAFHPWVMVLFLAVAAPWHILVSLKNPEFFDFYFIQEHLLRYTTTLHRRSQPAWFFVPVFLLGFFPWVSFFYGSVRQGWTKENLQFRSFFLFALCWIGFIFVFFSFSQSKLIPYLLPVFLPLSLLVGFFLDDAWQKGASLTYYRQGLFFWKILAFLVGVSAIIYPLVSNLELSPLLITLFILVLLVCCTAIFGLRYFLNGTPQGEIPFIFVCTVSLLMIGAVLDPFVQPRPSMKPFAAKLKTLATPKDAIVTYGRYYQDLPVYLGRTVQVVNWSGELDFGARIEPAQDRVISLAHFWALWGSPASVFMITPVAVYEEFLKEKQPQLHFVFQENKTVLLHNHPVFAR